MSEKALVFRLLEDFCKRNDLILNAGDHRGHAGRVTDGAGNSWFFVGTRFDLNPLGAAEIANDKAYAAHFLAEAGISVPMGCFVQKSDLGEPSNLPTDVQDLVEHAGYPLFVKPNTGKEGKGVQKTHSQKELKEALVAVCSEFGSGIVQEAIAGREIRILVLDGEILASFERQPPSVTGDGRSPVQDLLLQNKDLDADDPRLVSELDRQDLGLSSVPEAGRTIRLLPVANLSRGGTGRFLTKELPEPVLHMARRSAAVLGLRYAGIDLIVPSSDASEAGAVVLEVNAAPGLSNLHRQGPEEAATVEEIYHKVFSAAFGR